MEFLIGLDPGGKGNFGWCVVADKPKLPDTAVASGLADNADGAVAAALAAIPVDGHIRCAGIHAPLFWPLSGPRNADLAVRAAIRTAGCRHASGTVQDVNSLRGACLVQGMLAAMKLRELYPTLPITEAHPKALRWLFAEVEAFAVVEEFSMKSDHERDALLAAIAAWAGARKLTDWQDLLVMERAYYSPVSQPLHYFMPGVSHGDRLKEIQPRG